MKQLSLLFAVLAIVVAACGTPDDVADTTAPSTPSTSAEATTSPPAPTTTVADDGPTTTSTLAVEFVTTTTKVPPAAPSTSLPDLTVPPGIDPLSVPQVSFAVADLAEMLGVAPDTIIIVGFQEVVWRDGSIGCPQPGMSYTQALVDGMQIVLESDGIAYDYHAGGNRDPFLCVNPSTD